MNARLAGLALLALLVAAVAWQWHADDAQTREYTLTALDPDAVQSIEVELKGLPAQRFDRRDGHWTSPAGPVDEGRAQELAALAATPVSAWTPASGFEAAKIGLAPPLATLVLDGTRIEFGEMTALGKQRYARVAGRVAFVPAQALPRAPRTASLPTTTSTAR
ncbi:hypothetical protein J2T07_001148 [Luteibacter jiangsuensis]|uniref:DUF4340 domain-containing protein n=1 Tax=Luteibacter jiangsuensis TaxID=637577 RepID=A0ABT9SVF1_9GAMM|nr:hypothetical protein [Luteibacter jiangsuensis]MDQ0008971.1 hypothetical protein [Luteibacter jiangsuensis]